MADDWIKMRTDLYRDPKVCVIADSLMDSNSQLAMFVNQVCQRDMTVTRNVTRCATVGALVTVWGVVRHRGQRVGDDLFCPRVTVSVIDDIADLPGFGEAMEFVGWVKQTEKGLCFPNFFSQYNTQPDASPAAERQRRYRDKLKALRDVTRDVTRDDREEKRREEKSITSAAQKKKKEKPPVASPGLENHHQQFIAEFTRMWSESHGGERYPFSGGKDAKAAKSILTALGDNPSKWHAVFAAYFADTSDFYLGHDLAKLASHLARFIGKSNPAPQKARPLTVEETAHGKPDGQGGFLFNVKVCKRPECERSECIAARADNA